MSNSIYINAADFAELAGISKSTLFKLAKDGIAPKPIKVSPKKRQWLRSEVTTYIEKRNQNRD